MDDTYSTYDAKAKFSEILRKVREGKTITVSYHGKPVAEIRPIREEGELEDRLRRMEDTGVLVRAKEHHARLGQVKRRPGALARFLADRDA